MAQYGHHSYLFSDVPLSLPCPYPFPDIYLARNRAYEGLGKTRHADADLAEAIRLEPLFADEETREASLAGKSRPSISD
jgi:hypothetical protein